MNFNPFKNSQIKKNRAAVEAEANAFVEHLEKSQGFMNQYSQSFLFPEGKNMANVIQKSLDPLLFNDSVFLSKTKAMQTYFTSVIDYAAVFQIANTIAGLPVKLFRQGESETGEEIEDHPDASPLLDMPNPFMTWYDFIEGAVTLTELAGFVPVEVVFPESPKELFLIRPDMTDQIVGRQGLVGFRVNTSGIITSFDTEEMFQIKYFNPLDFHRGFTAFNPMSKVLSIELFVKQFTDSFFQNGGHIGGIVKKQGSIQPRDKENIKKQFIENYEGASKAFKLMVLGGGLEFEKTGVNPREADLEVQDKYTRMQILAGRGVPPILIGFLDGASYSNSETQIRIFFKSTIRPKATKIQQALNRHVFNKFGLEIKFDFSQIVELQEDKLKNAQTAVQMSNSRAFTINEIRSVSMGMTEITGGDMLPAPKTANDMAQETLADMEKSLSNLQLKKRALLGHESPEGLNGSKTGQRFDLPGFSLPTLNGSGKGF